MASIALREILIMTQHLLLIDIDHRQFLRSLEMAVFSVMRFAAIMEIVLENNRVNVLWPDIAARGRA